MAAFSYLKSGILLILSFFVRIAFVKPVINFFGEVRSELIKVTWPTRDEVIKLTLTVFVIAAILGLYVGGLDYLFTTGLAKFVTR